MNLQEKSQPLGEKPNRSFRKNLGTKIGLLALSGSLLFSGCKNAMPYNSQIDKHLNRSIIASTLEEESSIPLSEDQLIYLEGVIEGNYSGRIIIRKDFPFDLRWDPDTEDPFSDKQYNVYFRPTSKEKWVYLATTPGLIGGSSWDERGMPINGLPSEFSLSGSYEFGVDAVKYDNKKSDMHKSTDSTAAPSPWGVFTNGYCSPADANLNEVTSSDEIGNYITSGVYTDWGIRDSVDDWVTQHPGVKTYLAQTAEMRDKSYYNQPPLRIENERIVQIYRKRERIVPNVERRNYHILCA